MILRYEPRDITEVLVYRKEDNKEIFLARAFAQDLETESIALDEAKASSRKVREAGKTISNRSILNEICDRNLFTPPNKKTRKQRQQKEQVQATKGLPACVAHAEPSSAGFLAQLPTQKKTSQTEIFEEIEEEEAISAIRETPKVEVLDYEDLLDDYGF